MLVILDIEICSSQWYLMHMKDYDIIVLTAANEAQAGGYRKQLEWRRENGLIPENTHSLVIADPGGRRVGSLGSTLFVLSELADYLLESRKAASFEDLFRGLSYPGLSLRGRQSPDTSLYSPGKGFHPCAFCFRNRRASGTF